MKEAKQGTRLKIGDKVSTEFQGHKYAGEITSAVFIFDSPGVGPISRFECDMNPIEPTDKEIDQKLTELGFKPSENPHYRFEKRVKSWRVWVHRDEDTGFAFIKLGAHPEIPCKSYTAALNLVVAFMESVQE